MGEVWLPHDARAKNLQTGKSILEQFALAGISPRIVPNHKVRDRIAATRKVFPTITIDCTPASPDVPDLSVTGDLLEALKAYRREWDEEKQIFSEQPIHDWASDFADAFGYMCVVASPHVLIQDYSRADDDLRGHLQSLPGHQIYLPGYNLDTLHLEREAHLNRIASRIQ